MVTNPSATHDPAGQRCNAAPVPGMVAAQRAPRSARSANGVAASADATDQGEVASVNESEPHHGPFAGLRARVRATLHIIRANPTGRIALKVGVAVLGAIVVAVGLVLIPLPGPGWALVILGLAIWAIEFVWAKHLLHFTRLQVRRWTGWVRRQPWPLRLVIGLVGAFFIGGVVLASLKISFGIDLVENLWTYVTTH